MKPQKLGIESEAFADLRDRFDKALTLALQKMLKSRISDGTVSAEVSISMYERTDESGESVLVPEFVGVVKINLPMKGKMEVPKQDNLIMIPDPDGEGFLVANGQYTFEDMLEERDDAGEK